ncbi:hypothetical protein ACVW0P_003367 [Mucilaginibacter sp. UYNi724]
MSSKIISELQLFRNHLLIEIFSYESLHPCHGSQDFDDTKKEKYVVITVFTDMVI